MNVSSFHLSLLEPASLGRWGRLVLWGGLAGALLLVLAIAWKAPTLVPFVPLVLAGGVGVWKLFQHPLLNLAVVLGASVMVASRQEGFQATEVLYGAYLLGYLAHWYGTRLVLYRERIVESRTDAAMLLLLAWITVVGYGGNFLHGGSLTQAISEWVALIVFAFYFPIKEACVRYRRGPHVIAAVLIWLGIFFALRNLLNYQQMVLQATAVWEIAHGRVASYEMSLLLPSIMTLILLLHVRQWRHRLALLLGFLVFFSSLILTQSRGYWIDFAFALPFLYVMIDPGRRKKLVIWALVGCAGVGILAMVFFGDMVKLVLMGLSERLMSIGTALSTDLSLINRVHESWAVMDAIWQHPLLGYGVGVSYRVYDILYEVTMVKSYNHNGFLSLWYRFGLVGLTLTLYVWGSSIWTALSIYRRVSVADSTRVMSLVAGICLIAIIPSTNTSNPFYITHLTLPVALLLGWTSGLRRRVEGEGDGAGLRSATSRSPG